MVPYFLDFHENIRFSKTLRGYQEQPYPLEKTTIVFPDLTKKACDIRRIFMEEPGNFPMFIFPGQFFGIFFGISLGIFPNIPGISQGNTPRIFHEHIFARWVTAQLGR